MKECSFPPRRGLAKPEQFSKISKNNPALNISSAIGIVLFGGVSESRLATSVQTSFSVCPPRCGPSPDERTQNGVQRSEPHHNLTICHTAAGRTNVFLTLRPNIINNITLAIATAPFTTWCLTSCQKGSGLDHQCLQTTSRPQKA